MPERFALSLTALADIARDFEDRVGEGLALDGWEIKGLITYAMASPTPEREALVLDIGGTSVRAAWVKVGPETRVLAQPLVTDLPIERGVPLPKAEFLGAQTDLLRRLGAPDGLPLGYCFSYPATSLPDGDAVLLNWTKEVYVPETEGRRVGRMLLEALSKAGLECSGVTVVNDTVAAMLAGLVGKPADATLGLIVGTGTNMSLLLPNYVIPKFPSDIEWEGPVPVNLESGNYTPPGLTDADHSVDAASDEPGTQRFEKAVSGAYLGRVLAAAMPGSDFDAESGSVGVVKVMQEGTHPLSAIARSIVRRSARLVAATLAGAIRHLPEEAETVRVVAEGSLFWRAPGYADEVRNTLRSLLPLVGCDHIRFEIVSRDYANLIGTALAAR